MPSAKAAIDALTDSLIIADDGPAHVRSLLFRAPTVSGVHALTMTVIDLAAQAA